MSGYNPPKTRESKASLGSTNAVNAPLSPRLQPRQSSVVEMLSTPPPLGNTPMRSSASDGSPADAAASPFRSQASPLLSDGSEVPGLNFNYPASPLLPKTGSSASISSSGALSVSSEDVDWTSVQLTELVEQGKLIIIDCTMAVEEAFQTLIKHNLTSLPVVMDPEAACSSISTFDYTDINAYLLLVLGKLVPPESIWNKTLNTSGLVFSEAQVKQFVEDARSGRQVPVGFVCQLSAKNPFVRFNDKETLAPVVEVLGSGVHRIAITSDSCGCGAAEPGSLATRCGIVGILSQRRLIRYFWENARRFKSLEPLLQTSLKDLNIGSTSVISITGDRPLHEALQIMQNEKMSSLAVVDANFNLLGNISIVDVKHVTRSSQSNLLYNSCLHFISVILRSRGLEHGKDSFPIFHVTPKSSLARTLAKLVATQAHRLWIVADEPVAGSTGSYGADSAMRQGKLIGVVSLSDILSTMARSIGRAHVDPRAARRHRRRSSSSSQSSRSSRSSIETFRKSVR